MDKLDRLGWASGMSIEAFGVRVGFRVKDPEVLRLLPERFPFGWKPSTSARVDRLYSVDIPKNSPNSRVRRFGLLYGDATQLARTLNTEDLLDILEGDLRLYVAENARRRTFVHAGVVGWKGRAILFPGRSFSGKTTLVAGLIRAGATYSSDEYAVLDAKGRVHPFAKPLSIRHRGRKQSDQSAESLGGVSGRKPLPVGLVILCRWNGKRWRPKALSQGLGTLEMIAHTVSARRSPTDSLMAIQSVVLKAPILQSSRGEVGEAVEGIFAYTQAAGW